MTFLELCQRLHREMRDSGVGMTSVEKQTGKYQEVVDSVREAWMDIQTQRTWDAEFWGVKDVETGELYTQDNPQILKTSLEMPFVPEQFQLIIVWKAMMGDSVRLNAPELRAKAQEKYEEQLLKLCNRYFGQELGVPKKIDPDVEWWW
ncbi:hypothetical protein [Vibrio litoralis]|uniref:hypothetical protein n=1 Tax=Vibrio litoralis TaxID=335972 RepID=UPI00040757C6|nr:hypothetical protein [Vibrio litoralis]